MDDLDQAVQALLDHDREEVRRKDRRYDLVKRIVAAVQARGHYPCADGDPIEFRCGDVIVEIPTEHAVKLRVVERLRAANDDA